MFSWFKKHFIPHEGNDHSPHILRDSSVRSIVVLVIILEIASFLIPVLSHLNLTGGMAAVLPAVLAELTNEERQAQNLPTLAINPILNQAALMKAQDMAKLGYFAHTSPEGKTPWYWIEKVGYKYQYAGENLAINFNDSKDVALAWMNSPTHKANIVKGNYTEIGTGIATGMYQGYQTVFVAQVYANPLPEVIPEKVVSKTTIKPTIKNTNKIVEEKVTVKNNPEPSNVLGSEFVTSVQDAGNGFVLNVERPTFWQKLLASPRYATNILLYFIFGVMFCALLLYFFIKIKNHSKNLITNALIILALILAIFMANYYWSYSRTIILDSLDYGNQSK